VKILIDWNSFEMGSALTETNLKMTTFNWSEMPLYYHRKAYATIKYK
jgi:hypothetical protein